MPLYEYQCDACGNQFERIQKFSDPPVESCPSCGGGVRKQISSPAFQFKGSGWYVTDYARPAATKDGGGSDAPAKDEAAKPADASKKDAAEKTSADKPAPAAETKS